LSEAVARDPASLARHLELVRHYYETGDAASFEQAAEAMYSRVYDPDHLAWKQVLAMGREIAPEHPLFAEDLRAETPEEPSALDTPLPPSMPQVEWGSAAKSNDVAATQELRIEDVQQGYDTRSQPVLDVPSVDAEPEPEIESFGYEPEPRSEPETESGSAFVDADASSTKLELARAYLDMGDVEGARGMLEEVVNEGNPGQRAEAKRLLDEIR
jgi:pilus assembly protein FimV